MPPCLSATTLQLKGHLADNVQELMQLQHSLRDARQRLKSGEKVAARSKADVENERQAQGMASKTQLDVQREENRALKSRLHDEKAEVTRLNVALESERRESEAMREQIDRMQASMREQSAYLAYGEEASFATAAGKKSKRKTKANAKAKAKAVAQLRLPKV